MVMGSFITKRGKPTCGDCSRVPADTESISAWGASIVPKFEAYCPECRSVYVDLSTREW